MAQQETDRQIPENDKTSPNTENHTPNKYTATSPQRSVGTVKFSFERKVSNDTSNVTIAEKSIHSSESHESFAGDVFAVPVRKNSNNQSRVAHTSSIRSKTTHSNHEQTPTEQLPNRLQSVAAPKTQLDEVDYATDIADDLLSQLMDLEEEVKAQGSSRVSSVANSRRSSNSSIHSKTNISATSTKRSTAFTTDANTIPEGKIHICVRIFISSSK